MGVFLERFLAGCLVCCLGLGRIADGPVVDGGGAVEVGAVDVGGAAMNWKGVPGGGSGGSNLLMRS